MLRAVGQSEEIPSDVLQEYLKRYWLTPEDLQQFPRLEALLKDKWNTDLYIEYQREDLQRHNETIRQQKTVIQNLQAALLADGKPPRR